MDKINDKIFLTDITGIGDPFTLAYDGKYYIYATSASNGFRVFVTEDFVHVEDKGLCFTDCTWGVSHFWAPEVIYYKGKFIMHYTSCATKEEGLRMSTAVADSPLGPFVDISDKPVFDFGWPSIDGTAFIDDDGQGYFYFSRDCSRNIIDGKHVSQIYGVKLSPDMLRPVGEPVLISQPETEWEFKSGDWLWNEGPAMLKHDGKYYLSYSVNCYTSLYYSVCYSVSDSPLSGFVKAKENPILKYIDGVMSGPGHNSYFKTFDGQLMTSFHIHSDYEKRGGNRRICFAKAFFKDGKLVIDYE